MTFEKLAELIHDNKIEGETSRKIIVKILEAERDWRTPLKTIGDFLIALEKEVDGSITKTSLNELLKKYNENITQYAWEAESICYLLDIFKWTEETELRKIFQQFVYHPINNTK